MNIKDVLIFGMKQVPALESRILLCFTLGKSVEYLLSHSEDVIPEEAKSRFISYIERRVALEPIAYITGKREFFDKDFVVTKDVLIPRPDSETLIETVMACSPRPQKILELGVGSGCLILTLLMQFKDATGIGVDINPKALAVAKLNAKNHGLNDRVELIASNWFESVQKQKFDVIISNPPYISTSEHVAKETMLYEPHGALFAEANGLEAYIQIALQAKDFLTSDGLLYLEIGFDQEKSVCELFAEAGYKLVKTARDLSGHTRCLVIGV